MKKPDRRTNRTQAALRKALLDLIAEKEYSEITVEEVVQRADVARATFYLHYKDKDELLLDYFTGLISDRLQQFARFSLSLLGVGGTGDPVLSLPVSERPIAGVFQHASENAALYRLALKGEGSLVIAEQLRRFTIEALDDLLQTKVKEAGLETNLQVPLDLVAHAYVGGFLACLSWWLEHNMPYAPEDMARRYRLMFMPGLRAALGINDTL